MAMGDVGPVQPFENLPETGGHPGVPPVLVDLGPRLGGDEDGIPAGGASGHDHRGHGHIPLTREEGEQRPMLDLAETSRGQGGLETAQPDPAPQCGEKARGGGVPTVDLHFQPSSGRVCRFQLEDADTLSVQRAHGNDGHAETGHPRNHVRHVRPSPRRAEDEMNRGGGEECHRQTGQGQGRRDGIE